MNFLAFFSFLLIFSTSIHSQDLIPLSKNNKWTYIKTEFLNNEMIKKDTSYSFIEKTVKVNGKLWYVVNEDGFEYAVRNEAKQQFELDSSKVDTYGNYKEFLVFGLPEKGEELNYEVGFEKVTVKNNLHKINTKAGNFECIKYEFKDPNSSKNYIHTYICPGVGIIKSDMVSGNEKIELVLISYALN